MNKAQKIILSISIPFILIFAGYITAGTVFDKKLNFTCPFSPQEMIMGVNPCKGLELQYYRDNPPIKALDLEETWAVWMLTVALIIGVELYLFRDLNR